MKNYKLLFGILATLFIFSCSPDDSGGNGQSLNAKLPKKISYFYKLNSEWIKSPDSLVFTYNSDNTVNIIKEYFGDNVFISSFQYENGYLKTKLTLYSSYSTEEKYTYNTQNQLIKQEEIIPDFEDDYSSEYFYTSEGQLNYMLSNNIKLTFEHDLQGNIIHTSKFPKDNYVNDTYYTYDNKKNPFVNLSSKMKAVLVTPFVLNIFAGEFAYSPLLLTSNPNNMIYSNEEWQSYIVTNTYNYVYDNEGYPIEIRGISIHPGREIKYIYEYYE